MFPGELGTFVRRMIRQVCAYEEMVTPKTLRLIADSSNQQLGGGFKYCMFYFHSYLGKMNPFWRSHNFFKGVETKPPTGQRQRWMPCIFVGAWPSPFWRLKRRQQLPCKAQGIPRLPGPLVSPNIAGWNISPFFHRKYIDSIRVHFPASYVSLPEGTVSFGMFVQNIHQTWRKPPEFFWVFHWSAKALSRLSKEFFFFLNFWLVPITFEFIPFEDRTILKKTTSETFTCEKTPPKRPSRTKTLWVSNPLSKKVKTPQFPTSPRQKHVSSAPLYMYQHLQLRGLGRSKELAAGFTFYQPWRNVPRRLASLESTAPETWAFFFFWKRTLWSWKRSGKRRGFAVGGFCVFTWLFISDFQQGICSTLKNLDLCLPYWAHVSIVCFPFAWEQLRSIGEALSLWIRLSHVSHLLLRATI